MHSIHSRVHNCNHCEKDGRLIQMDNALALDHYIGGNIELCLPCLKKAVKILESLDDEQEH